MVIRASENVESVVSYLKSPEVIAFPDFHVPFFIHCDASNMGFGGVLYQKHDENLRVISFASRKLSPAEKNYNLQLEFLALKLVKWCITEKFSDYLHYGPRFTAYTDNRGVNYSFERRIGFFGFYWIFLDFSGFFLDFFGFFGFLGNFSREVYGIFSS